MRGAGAGPAVQHSKNVLARAAAEHAMRTCQGCWTGSLVRDESSPQLNKDHAAREPGPDDAEPDTKANIGQSEKITTSQGRWAGRLALNLAMRLTRTSEAATVGPMNAHQRATPTPPPVSRMPEPPKLWRKKEPPEPAEALQDHMWPTTGCRNAGLWGATAGPWVHQHGTNQSLY